MTVRKQLICDVCGVHLEDGEDWKTWSEIQLQCRGGGWSIQHVRIDLCPDHSAAIYKSILEGPRHIGQVLVAYPPETQ